MLSSSFRTFPTWCSVEVLLCIPQVPCAGSWSKLKLLTRSSRHRVVSWSVSWGGISALWSLLYTNDTNQFSLVKWEHSTYQTG